MAREELGRTRWGNLWMEALEKIEQDREKLDAAKNYFLKEDFNIENIEDEEIKGRFRSEDGQQYDVSVKLSEFDENSKKVIKKIVRENPAFASALSLGTLPEELNESLEKKQVNLFLKDRDGIKSYCSCDGNNELCVHVFALCYALTGLLDKDPFILFSIRGISKEFILNSVGIASDPDEETKDITDGKFVPYRKLKSWSKTVDDSELDLSFQDINIKSLFTLLTDNPLFYTEENFKLILIEKYKSLSSFVDSFDIQDEINPHLKDLEFYLAFFTREISKSAGENTFTADEKYPPVFLISDRIGLSQIKTKPESLTLSVPDFSDNGDVFYADKKLKISDLDDVLQFFISQPLEMSPEITRSAGIFNLAASIALAMVKTFSFIPEVVSREEGSFFIHYIPLIHDEKTRKAVEFLEKAVRPDLVIKADEEYALEKDIHLFLLSLFITNIVRFFDNKYGRNFFFFDQKVYNTFFKGEIFRIEKFEENNIAKTIVDWLERLSFRSKDISPVVKIDSIAEDKYSVEIRAENKKETDIQDVSLKTVFQSKKDLLNFDITTVRTDLLRQITIAGDYFPVLNEILNSKGEQPGIITSEEMYEFVTSVSETLNLLGIRVILPRELKDLKAPKLVISGTSKFDSDKVTYFSIKDLLEINWEVEIGETVIPVDQFYKLSQVSKGIVQVNGQYFVIKPEEAEQIIEQSRRKPDKLTSKDLIKIVLTGELDGKVFHPDSKLITILEDLFKIKEIDLPENLQAVLRPYQVRGYRWLYSNSEKDFGSCLADDMGLGKTLQVISLILKLKQENPSFKPVLVICPTTLIGNWAKEISKFAPGLKALIYHGARRRLIMKNADVVISSYGIIRSDIEKFTKLNWEIVVIDEAQNIKNPDADQTRAVKQINSQKHIAMSGTPVENRLSELWSIYDFLNKDYLGTLGSFKKNYAVPIEKYRDQERINKLKKLISPFLLRRLKSDEDIIQDLPEKIIFDEYCYLSDLQTKLYQETVKDAFEKIKGNKGIERKGAIFSLITHLKQICNHPSQFDKSENPDPLLSGKSEKLIEMLEKMRGRNEKVIIFTQYKQMGDILVQMLNKNLEAGILFFNGSIPRQRRDEMINKFQEDKNYPIMILSLKAGGTGLNLTAAKRVIHYDLWWNPAVEAQATDRVYRIGQTKNITVHRFITLNTFEEKIDDMIKRKKELSELTISAGENWITELTDRELKKIFSLS